MREFHEPVIIILCVFGKIPDLLKIFYICKKNIKFSVAVGLISTIYKIMTIHLLKSIWTPILCII